MKHNNETRRRKRRNQGAGGGPPFTGIEEREVAAEMTKCWKS